MNKKIILYINQFFAGKGGEDMADYKIEIIDSMIRKNLIKQLERAKKMIRSTNCKQSID